MMGWLQERYDLKGRNLDLVITESGVATPPHQIDDNLRVIYLDGYIRKALQAQADFGISLVIYCVWSLMDNFEWAASYSENYGLLSVNFETPERTRTPKTSAYWLREQTFF
jgi:beta-glucosidase/6-phospho-beta-glucosidase/beta-galactosidase